MRTVLFVALLLIGLPAYSATEAEKQATEAQINALKKQVSALERSISSRQSKQKALAEALRDSERQIGEVSRELKSLGADLSTLDSDLAGLKGRERELEQQLASGKKLILALMREQYQQGQQPQLQLMLSERDPARGERLLHYYDHLNADLARRLHAYQAQLQALTETREQAAQTNADMLQKREALAAQEAQLRAARDKRAHSLAELKSALKQERDRLGQLNQDRRQLETLLIQIQKALEKSRLAVNDRAFASLKGTLSWPIDGKVLRGFGSSENGVRYEGMLIAAQPGREIHAVHAGRVVFANWLRGYGLLLIIDHGSGYMSMYGHNQSLLRETGDWVSAGEPVATAGNSGGYDAVGLYFAIRHKGSSIDPAQWLARR